MKKLHLKILLLVFLLPVIFSPVFGAYQAKAGTVEPLTGSTYTDSGGNLIDSVTGQIIDSTPNDITPGAGGVVDQGANSPGAEKAKDSSKREEPKPPINASCVGGSFPFFHLDACVALIVNMLMWIVSWFLYLAGFIFDQSMQFTLNISDLMTRVPVVDIGWKIFRDLANVFFIFILLWIAMSTILGFNSGKTKELIVHLVVVAILMNFSLFITKTIIDGSNIIALHFYNLIVGSPQNGFLNQGSMSGAFMEGLRIQTIYDGSAVGDTEGQKPRQTWGNYFKNVGTSIAAGSAVAGPVGGVVAGAAALTGRGNVINWGKIILIGVFGSALMLIAGYVFLVGAVLMLIRAIVLMFVMMLSPLAFLAFAMPFAEKFVEPWKEALIKQCIFAPAFMALSYVVVKTIQSPAFKGVTTVTVGAFSSAFTAGSGGGVAMIMNFLLVIGLMLGCILVAKKLEVHGLEFAKSVGAKGAMWVASGRFITTTAGVVGYGFKGVGRVAGAGVQGIKGVAEAWKNPKELGRKMGMGMGNLADKAGKIPGQIGAKAKAGFESTKQFMSEPEKWREKTDAFGEAIHRKAESVKKIIDVNELDKKFKQSAFGATELGNWLREQTIDRAVRAKFGGEKTQRESYEESEKLRERRAEIENMEFAEQQNARYKIAKSNADRYKQPTEKNFTRADGSLDSEAYKAAMKNYLALYAPKHEEYANDADFKKAMDNFNLRMDLLVKRSDFVAGPAGDRHFTQTLTENVKDLFEKPTFAKAGDPELEAAKKIANGRNNEKEEIFSALKIQQTNASEAVARIDPSHFADMNEHKIKELAPLASVSQLKAVKDAKHWTIDEKKEMIGVRWEEKFSRVLEFDDKNKHYESAMQAVRKAAIAGKLETDAEGNVLEITTDGSNRKQIEVENGVIYAFYTDDTGKKIRLEMPKEPEMSKDLIHWIRNEMTLPEFEIAAAFKPEMFRNKSFMSAVRFPIVFKEFRTNQNWPAEIRDLMTYIKNAPLDLVRELPEDSEETLKKAFASAVKAAELAPDDEKDKVLRKTFSKNAPGYAIKTSVTINHAKERSEEELTSSRSRDRTNEHVMNLYGKKATKLFAPKDIKDIVVYFRHLMKAVQNERDHKGLVSQQNREAIKYLFTDERSADIPRAAVAELEDNLRELYYELQKEGEETKEIVFETDKYRNIKHKKGGGTTP